MATTMNASIELYFETFGEFVDPHLILLPGMGNQLLVYPEEFCLAFVDRGFHVIRMDNRDSGLSGATDESGKYTLADMADDVVAVIDQLDIAKVVVLGLSLGGMIAQQVAADHPDRVQALVSLSSTTGEANLPSAAPEIIAALLAPDAPTREEQIESDLQARAMWSNPEWFDRDQMRAYFASLYERAVVPGGGLRQLSAAQRSPSRVATLEELDIPTLVVHGENDTLIPIEHGQRTAEIIPGAEFLQIDGMSHDFVYQCWPPLVEAVTSLVARTFD